MNDSSEQFTQGGRPGGLEWLLLIHQLPPEPAYFRVKVRRRLHRLGAVALKNSVYLLPRREETVEDFQWLLREIRSDGGEATLCQASVIEGTSDAELIAMFRAEREADYAELEQQARAEDADPTRLRKRLSEVTGIDFFGAPSRAAAERALSAAEARQAVAETPVPVPAEAKLVRGGTWVTRRGVFVDRIGCAWLVRRFIDPEARFKFVEEKGHQPAPGELRFDMYQGEFTHQGDRCTFEVLLASFGLNDPALAAVGEIVHDIDCKDEKFGRPEAAGVESVLRGLALAHPADAERLERGGALFDGLYAQLRAGG